MGVTDARSRAAYVFVSMLPTVVLYADDPRLDIGEVIADLTYPYTRPVISSKIATMAKVMTIDCTANPFLIINTPFYIHPGGACP